MGWRFRKSFSPFPGVRLTLSPSGVSTSVGVGPVRLTAGPRGPSFTANVPGTGLSFRQSLAGGSGSQPVGDPVRDPTPIVPLPTPVSSVPDLQEIRSAGSGILTTPGLAEFKSLLERARQEHAEIVRELGQRRTEESAAVGKFNRWNNGWLFRRLFKAKFEHLRLAAEESTARRTELEQQEQLARLQTQIDLPPRVKEAFHLACDRFASMAKAHSIWDTVGQRSTNRLAERTTATRTVERKPVTFKLGKCELIESEWSVPHLQNANGGDIYFYPAFVLYFVGAESFALLEYKQTQLAFAATRFIETDPIPRDSKVVGSTWAKANKDGSPDKRFKGNFEIPIAEYGKLVITSETGMNEEYMLSNVESTDAFSNAWQALAKAVAAGV
jgi:hypothetical protein